MTTVTATESATVRVMANDLDEDGRPDYSGGGHNHSDLAAIRHALRCDMDEARAELGRMFEEEGDTSEGPLRCVSDVYDRTGDYLPCAATASGRRRSSSCAATGGRTRRVT